MIEEGANKRNFEQIDSRAHIPMAYHNDVRTILTRNGELVQAIKVEGWTQGPSDQMQDDLRATLRYGLTKLVENRDIIAYTYIVRDFSDISIKKDLQIPLARQMHSEWNRHYEWRHKLANSMYIVLVHQGMRNKLGGGNFAKNSFMPLLSHTFFSGITKAQAKLTAVVDGLCDILRNFGSRVLEIKKNDQGLYFSEILSLFNYITRMSYREVLMDRIHAAELICDGMNLALTGNGQNLIFSDGSQERHVALFSLRTTTNFNLWTAEQVLQTPCQMVISEIIEFVPRKEATSDWQYHFDIATSSRANELIDIGDLLPMLDPAHNAKNSFCKQQNIFNIFGESSEQLQHNISEFTKIVAEIGMSIVREDIGANGLFWSQFPGNMHLVQRTNYNLTKYAKVFSNTWPKSMGRRWGNPLIVFADSKTLSPYYFHLQDSGKADHCAIFECSTPNPTAKTLLHHLIAHGSDASPLIFSIDLKGERGEQDFMGHFASKLITSANTSINLLATIAERSPGYEPALLAAAQHLLEHIAPSYATDADNQKLLLRLLGLNKAGDTASAEASTDVSLLAAESTQSEAAKPESASTPETSKTLEDVLSEWLKKPEARAVTGQDPAKDLLSTTLHPITDSKAYLIDCSTLAPPIYAEFFAFGALMEIASLIDKKPPSEPAIIAIQQADFLFELPATLVALLCGFLEEAQHKNCTVLMKVVNRDKTLRSSNATSILSCFNNLMIVTDRTINREHRKILRISDKEIYSIKASTKQPGSFLLKKADHTMITTIPLQSG